MTTQQLEDWLGQQKIYLAHFNRLIAEKAALEERLSQISAEIGRVATGSFEGMLSFP
jgi:thiaminase